MSTTINISLPTKMYEDAKEYLKIHGYASISELVRDTMRGLLYSRLTVNGFTPEFEQQVLEAAAEPFDEDRVLETEKDIHDYFLHGKLPKKKKPKAKK